MKRFASIMLVALVAFAGCQGEPEKVEEATGEVPTFTNSYSEYLSWATFEVAENLGVLNGEPGKQGTFEKKYNVDVVLEFSEYDTCIVKYNSGTADSVCITNMDILPLAIERPTRAIIPTSKSEGADALIVSKNIQTIDDLKNTKIYGLDKSVSKFTLIGCAEAAGVDPNALNFVNQDPGAASQAFLQSQEGYDAIVVWHPFTHNVLKLKPDARVFETNGMKWDSSAIPGQIIDMVVIAEDSLKREGGERYALCLLQSFYAVCKAINDPSSREDALFDLAEAARFKGLSVEEVEKIMTQTKFFYTPEDALALFQGKELPETMKIVVDRDKSMGVLAEDANPQIEYGSNKADLVFDPTFLSELAQKASE